MARLESTSVTCKPEEENSRIDLFERFGWTLKSSQEIFNKDSHTEVQHGTRYSVTETTNYVKLVFTRDKDMPYYNEIVSLENKYNSLTTPPPSFKKGMKILIWAGIILMFVLTTIIRVTWLNVIFTLIGIAGIVFFFILRAKGKKADAAALQKMHKVQDKILKQVANYV
ncbi:MAG: hypothetical protein IKP38_00125 [Clostridia bacterium]|nr:hypothetical protein [Clostridia bacterium]